LPQLTRKALKTAKKCVLYATHMRKIIGKNLCIF
jgi:hypothetical protein